MEEVINEVIQLSTPGDSAVTQDYIDELKKLSELYQNEYLGEKVAKIENGFKELTEACKQVNESKIKFDEKNAELKVLVKSKNAQLGEKKSLQVSAEDKETASFIDHHLSSKDKLEKFFDEMTDQADKVKEQYQLFCQKDRLFKSKNNELVLQFGPLTLARKALIDDRKN